MAEKSNKLPSPSASAEEVRAYITQLLVTKYSTPVEIAASHAAKWEIGTFSQLSKASLQSLSDIFNSNVGLCLYNGVREDMCDHLEKQPSVIFAKYVARISVVILVSVLLLALSWSLGFPIPKDVALWAKSPLPWFFFSGAMVYYVYKHSFKDSSGVVFRVILIYVALIVGVFFSKV
ncbi:hypothetical protein ASPVEDRAFT_88438 [Aspergillus versicolor CBS 583.65]|uniref:Uncharacterized protein n=1 Tax=Aspergillus versicolor CBS 583.65 TaxID=1036611 RepID=A0A1L9Q082_ASPVE|nr:uncharacterized protein ASPVEDRAFT_88438 [Aspergillus versicolor CBS 583.65]OJJ07184.1 hypothetical protein ASPVEDRAFT_88438 [Aspergillus versicolor CBS 583.65]